MPDQFGSWDGRDNRKTVMDLFHRLGHGLDERRAMAKRAEFLRLLPSLSKNSFGSLPCAITPMTTTDAYFAFVAITGCMGVDINMAASRLEEYVRNGR